MTTATATLKQSLDQRVESAVAHTFRCVAKMNAHRVSMDDQKRHLGRMISCQTTLFGTGWIGTLVLLLPADFGPTLACEITGDKALLHPKGCDIAEAVGTLSAAISFEFGRSFTDEDKITVGMPTVATGSDLAVSFPWGNDFETRQAYTSEQSPFWAILRLSHTQSR